MDLTADCIRDNDYLIKRGMYLSKCLAEPVGDGMICTRIIGDITASGIPFLQCLYLDSVFIPRSTCISLL